MLKDSEFSRIVNYVKRNYGIDLKEKEILISGRLENYLLRNGFTSYHEYMDLIERNPNSKEAKNLVNALTTNHTYFMRESEHFDYLRRVVLPQIKKKEERTKDLRIWSGASSTGEEPYGLAMVIKDFFGLEHNAWDTTLLATDLSTQVLEHASKGIYLGEQIAPIPDRWKRMHFKKIDQERYRVKDELRKQVIFRQFNLMNPFPFKKKFHVVFMRNVMIYFEDDVKYALVKKIYDSMEPGGYLFIGTTESLDRSKTDFQLIQPSIYRKI